MNIMTLKVSFLLYLKKPPEPESTTPLLFLNWLFKKISSSRAVKLYELRSVECKMCCGFIFLNINATVWKMVRRIWNDCLTKNAAYICSLILCFLQAHFESTFGFGAHSEWFKRCSVLFILSYKECDCFSKNKKNPKTTKTNQNKKNTPWYLSKTTHYRVKRSELLFWWMLLHSTFYSKCLNWWTLLVNTEWIEVPYAEDIKCRNKVLLLSKPSEFLANSKLI